MDPIDSHRSRTNDVLEQSPWVWGALTLAVVVVIAVTVLRVLRIA